MASKDAVLKNLFVKMCTRDQKGLLLIYKPSCGIATSLPDTLESVAELQWHSPGF